MVTEVLATRSLIVVRCFRIAVACCMLSWPFSPVAFLRYWFAFFGVRCTLFAPHCSHYADDSMLRATSVLLLAAGYRLFAFRCLVFVSRSLALVSRCSSYGCSLRITHWILSVIPYLLLTGSCCLSLLSCHLLIAARLRGLIIPARGLLFCYSLLNT